MPRIARSAPGGMVYHVINRANGRLRLFKTEADFAAFEKALLETHAKFPIPILAWCIMQNHWHFVVQPTQDDELSRFFGRLGLLHATRWQAAHNAIGMGHVYQGRFKNFMIEEDEHLLWVLRYVERNPLRANLVKHAEDWRHSSLHVRRHGPAELSRLLADWPVSRPRDWIARVNRPQTPAEEAAIVNAINRGRPLGNAPWVTATAKRYDLLSTLRARGRQLGWRKKPEET
jgi:putative transposase